MNQRARSTPAQPDGFTDRSSGLAGQHAHEQGWRIIEVGKATVSKTKNSARTGKLYERAGRAVSTPSAGATGVLPQEAQSHAALAKTTVDQRKVICVRSPLVKNAA